MNFFWTCTPDLDSTGPCLLVPLHWRRDDDGWIIVSCNHAP